ncbi:MAG: hypothetical protein NTV43_12715 [Methylococcales bacterium]|nr:hypothetical protein [Methylococcales bacterium]
MTKITQILRTLPLLALALAANTAHASTIVAPNAYDATAGNQVLNTLINTSTRTYEMQIAASQLAGMAVGSSINGLAWRLASSEPAAGGIRNWSDFEITVGQAANTIAGMSTTFAANLLNPVLVRDGALSYDLSGFSNAGTPTPFAPSISFSTPYTYLGGDLVVLISHTTATGGTNSFLDGCILQQPVMAAIIGLCRTPHSKLPPQLQPLKSSPSPNSISPPQRLSPNRS